ncbi:MAG: PAS domain-containing sensor histidine kinase [Planctomycetota bacterium]
MSIGLSDLTARHPGLPTEPAHAGVPRQVQRFFDATDRAQRAFDALSSRVDELKNQLDEANRRLQEKVNELDRLSAHQRALLDGLADGVVAVDAERTIRFINPAAERLLGVRSGDLLGRSLAQTALNAKSLEAKIAQAADAGPVRLSLALARGSAARFPAALGVAPVTDARGTTIGVVLVIQDLTELATLQARAQRNEDLAEIGRLAAVVAHEVRNPLGGIEGFANLLREDLKGQPRSQKYAQHIVEGVSDLNRIVDNLLHFARQPKLHLESLSLKQLLPELIELARADAQGRRQIVRFRFDAATDGILSADRGMLRQVFLNLLRNAVEAVEPQGAGDVNVRLARASLDDAAAVAVEIHDSGPGLSEEVRGQLFQPFVTNKPKGTGLGLSTVKKIVTAHGGQIACVPDAAAGACFRVILPLNPISANEEN